MDKALIRKEKKELDILNAAIVCFKNNNIKKVTLDEIAATANVSKMTIYKYFGDKDSLYCFVGQHILKSYKEALDKILLTKNPFYDTFTGYFDVLVNYIVSGDWELNTHLKKLNKEFEVNFASFENDIELAILRLITKGQDLNIIVSNEKKEIIYHYINMGLTYFKYDPDYREKIVNDTSFSDDFMNFVLRNVFINNDIK